MLIFQFSSKSKYYILHSTYHKVRFTAVHDSSLDFFINENSRKDKLRHILGALHTHYGRLF